MKLSILFVVCVSWLLGGQSPVLAATAPAKQIATITKFFGKASILSPPSAAAGEDKARAIFEGVSYVIEPAKMGSKLFDGSVIQTGEKTMVRLVFDNGDQIMVSAQSSYKLSTEKKPGGEDKPVSDLLYGKFRAVISKEGPRNNMEVRTRTMVMGIRGTDFHVTAADASGASTVAVLRGAVAVAQKTAPSEPPAKPIEVASGFSARIPSVAEPKADAKASEPAAAAPIAVSATDKVDLIQIQESSSFKKSAEKAGAAVPAAAADPQLEAALAALETQALAATKLDIKGSDPELYKRIEAAESAGKKVESLDILQDVTVEKAIVRAPDASPEKQESFDQKNGKKPEPATPKPSRKELEKMEGSVYDKYFKQ